MFKHSSNSITSLKSEKRYIKNSPLGGWGVLLLFLSLLLFSPSAYPQSKQKKSAQKTAVTTKKKTSGKTASTKTSGKATTSKTTKKKGSTKKGSEGNSINSLKMQRDEIKKNIAKQEKALRANKAQVEKKLKDYRKKAHVPGFRPGQVPMGMIRKQMGSSVKVDEINRLLGEEMYKYIRENNIQMLGEPMPSDKQTPQDLEKEGPYTFIFDVAVAPEFTIQLSDKDKVEYLTVKVDDELIDRQVDMYASQQGHYDKVEEYDADQRDMLKGDLRQLDAEGNTLEGGITVDSASLLPQYIKVDE